MAKRQRASAGAAAALDANAPPREIPGDHVDADAGERASFITFRVGREAFGVRLEDVGEIIRMPALAHMPLAPQSLLGLANLRGTVLPVISLTHLIGFPDGPRDDAARVIVIERGTPVGIEVDRIDTLLTVPVSRLQAADPGAGGIDPDLLSGVIKGHEGEDTIKLLDVTRLLRGQFTRLQKSAASPAGHPAAAAFHAPKAAETRALQAFVSFDLGDQEYALPLDRVREIITLPAHVSAVPRAETAVLGVVTLRDRLLPLVSLRTLLGVPETAAGHEGRKVVVLSVGNARVGLLADRTREILRVDPDLIDPAPALLTRGDGDAEIASICRLDDGRRLVAVLSPDRLFRSDVVRRVLAEQDGDLPASQTDQSAMAEEQFVVFRLGDQEYGLPIAAVQEIARRPDRITRLPKAPKFIDGVMNLRGVVVPIVDLRRRFELPPHHAGSAQRILVLAIGPATAGFMVDGVSEIRKVDTAVISPAPEVSAEQMRLIGRVANLDGQGRMILLIDPAQLLDQAEVGQLARLDAAQADPTAKMA